jgi:hypothetical protein
VVCFLLSKKPGRIRKKRYFCARIDPEFFPEFIVYLRVFRWRIKAVLFRTTIIKFFMLKRLLTALLFLSACVKPETPPPGVIPKDQMTEILIDIHVAEAQVSHLNLRSYDSMQVAYNGFERDIFQKYRVDSTSYNQSYQYYLRNPKLMEEIYTAVVDSLALRESLGRLR